MKVDAAKLIIVPIVLITAIPLLLIEHGWAISTLWGWFITPLGVPEIGIAVAIGIAITFSSVVSRYRKSGADDKWEVIIHAFLHPLLAVGMGWVVKQFV